MMEKASDKGKLVSYITYSDEMRRGMDVAGAGSQYYV